MLQCVVVDADHQMIVATEVSMRCGPGRGNGGRGPGRGAGHRASPLWKTGHQGQRRVLRGPRYRVPQG